MGKFNKISFNRWRFYRKYYKQGLDGPRPMPIVGNTLNVMKKTFQNYELENRKKYGSTYVDYILDSNGVIVTSNPEYVKKILIKDFHNFYHRIQSIYVHKYLSKAVIFTNDDWKRIRSQVTPVFTTGRLKQMYKNFSYPIKTTLNNIEELIDSKQADKVDAKKLMKSFALDTIGNVVFSLKTNSFKNDGFAQKVMDLFRPRKWVILFVSVMPKTISWFLKLTNLKDEIVQYFADLTLSLIEERKKNKEIIYNDFIEMLLKSEAEGESVDKNFDENGHIVKKLSKQEIVGQCIIFFIAGMETVSTALALLLYELALNQEIQDKLYKELVDCYSDEEVSYDDLNKSRYLDCVINETLRKHTTVSRIFRKALADYDFGDFKIQKGQTMGISLYCLHMDENIYVDPHKFKPERFEENPNGFGISFIPFVDGPRNCVGNRFALVEMKSIVIQLIRKYRIFATDKTEIPLKQRKGATLNMIENITLGFERRTKF